MILTICIATLKSRKALLDILLSHLLTQIHEVAPDQVEISVCSDEGEMTTGAKRNKMYREANGEYVCSIDDDDWVPSYYIYEIMKALTAKPDAVAMNGTHTTNGAFPATWDISRYNPYVTTRKNGRIHYLRFHNHLSPVKKEIAIQFPFPDQKFAEDYAFAEAMHRADAIKTEVRVAKPMYEYRYRSHKMPNQ